jgi:hypothetical protein
MYGIFHKQKKVQQIIICFAVKRGTKNNISPCAQGIPSAPLPTHTDKGIANGIS